MVEMQMGIEDGIDVTRLQTGRREALEEAPSHERTEPGNLDLLVAVPRLDEDVAPPCLNKEAADAGHDPSMLIEPFRVEIPAVRGCPRKHRYLVDPSISIWKEGNPDAADGDFLLISR